MFNFIITIYDAWGGGGGLCKLVERFLFGIVAINLLAPEFYI